MTDALDLAAARVAASAAAAAPTPADRAEALTRLRELVRYGTGYSLPDGSTVRTWRACYRQWVPAPMGRPRSRLTLTVAPDVRAWLQAQDGGPAATVERLVRAAMSAEAAPGVDLAAIVGTWPGDETDEEIAAALVVEVSRADDGAVAVTAASTPPAPPAGPPRT